MKKTGVFFVVFVCFIGLAGITLTLWDSGQRQSLDIWPTRHAQPSVDRLWAEGDSGWVNFGSVFSDQNGNTWLSAGSPVFQKPEEVYRDKTEEMAGLGRKPIHILRERGGFALLFQPGSRPIPIWNSEVDDGTPRVPVTKVSTAALPPEGRP
jgi:hypothetical protein